MQTTESSVNPQISSSKPSYPKLDAYNIDVLTSQQYLRNYTYLQYMIFPQLFPKLLKILSYQEKLQLLKSYVGTMRDVWPEMTEKQHQYSKAFVQEFGRNNRLVKVCFGIIKEGSTINEGTMINEENIKSNIEHDNEMIERKLSQMQHAVAELASFPLKLTPQQLLKVRTLSTSLQWIIPYSKRVQIFSQISPYILTNSQYTKSQKTNSIASGLINLVTQITNDLFHQTNGHFHYSEDVPMFMYHMAIEDIYPLYRNVSKNFLSSLEGILKNEGLDDIVYYEMLIKLLPLIRQTEKFMKQHGQVTNNFEDSASYCVISEVLSSGHAGYLCRMVNIAENLQQFCLKRISPKQKSTHEPKQENFCPKQSHMSFCQFVKEVYPEMFGGKKQIDVDRMDGVSEGKEMTMDQVEKLVRMIGRIGMGKMTQNGHGMQIEQCNEKSLLTKRQNRRKMSRIQKQNQTHLSGQFLSLYFQLFQPSTLLRASQSVYLLNKIHAHINKSIQSIITLQFFSFEAYKNKVQRCDTEANLLLESLDGIVWISDDEKSKEVKRVKYELMIGLVITKLLKTTFFMRDEENQGQMGQEIIVEQPSPSMTITQTSQLLTQILQLSQINHCHICPQILLYLLSAVQLHKSITFLTPTNLKPLISTIINYLTAKQLLKSQQSYINCIRLINEQQSQFSEVSKDKKDRVKEMMKLWKGLLDRQGKDQEMMNFLDVINDQRLVLEYLIGVIGKLVGECFRGVRHNRMEGHQDTKQSNQLHIRQITLPFDQLFSLNHNQNATTQAVVKYLFNQVLLQLPLKISPQLHPTSNGLQQSLQPNQSSKTQFQAFLLNQPQNIPRVFQLFRGLKRKYEQIQQIKKQINKDDTTFGQFFSVQGLQQNITSRLMLSLLEMTQTLFTAFNHFMRNFMQNPRPSTNFNIKAYLNKSIKQITTQLIQTIIPAYITLFKPSPLLIEQLLKRQNLETSEQNKDKMTTEIKRLGEWLEAVREVGILVLVAVMWMKMEMEIGLKDSRQGQENNNKQEQGKLSIEDNPTNTLLSILTLVTLSDSLSINYHLLQSNLQSNFQPSIQSQQQPIFPKIPLTQQFTSTITHVASYELIEFVYEYFSFQISSQEEQMRLHRLMKNWVQKEENHQFLSEVKRGKVKLRKLINFLEIIRKQP